MEVFHAIVGGCAAVAVAAVVPPAVAVLLARLMLLVQ
jgi:hypothetical protein